MLKAYKYRVYPTEKQKQLIEKHFGCCRLVYNLSLATRIEAYAKLRVQISTYELIKQLPDLKAACPFLGEVNSQSLQLSIKNMDSAFRQFFRGRGFPRYKKKRADQSFTALQQVYVADGKLSLPKFREGVRMVIDRQHRGAIKKATVSRTGTGKYFVSILTETGTAAPEKRPVDYPTAVGVDVGLKDLVVTCRGIRVPPPKGVSKRLERIRVLQRRLSRKNRGSANYRKTRSRISLLHEKVANIRKDCLHQISTGLIKNHDTVCIENLHVRGMMKNPNLARAIGESGWSKFHEMLKYKAGWYGKNIGVADRFEPTSKECAVCHSINKSLKLSERLWVCINCGTAHDRDQNAAENIKRAGLKKLTGVGNPGVPVEPFPVSDGQGSRNFMYQNSE